MANNERTDELADDLRAWTRQLRGLAERESAPTVAPGVYGADGKMVPRERIELDADGEPKF